MSRSGYSDDFGEGDTDYSLSLYRQAVRNATLGRRGQDLLRKLRDALDAMPVKRLIAGAIKGEAGEVCVFGALDPNAPSPPLEDEFDDGDHSIDLAKHFGIARSLAAEVMFMNDEWDSWRMRDETPEHRWTRMRAWVDEQIAEQRTKNSHA